jgi:hypothetical protein
MAMSSDYLWDKTGRDPEVEALERLLAPAALGAARSRKSSSLAWIAGVAAAALFAVGAFQALRRPAPVESPSVRRPAPVESTWVVQKDGRSVLDLGRYGTVVAEKDAAVRVLRRDDELQSLRLDRGTIHASITSQARPRLFQVETPSTTCIDLGCRYTLTVDDQGTTTVTVKTGRVLFDHGSRDVFIPNGASCRAAPGRAPFTPIYDTASGALKKAVETFDAATVGHRTPQAKAACELIKSREDGLVAWHWLQDPEVDVVKAAREALVRLTSLGECGIPRVTDKGERELRAWRDNLFPEWKDWD